MVLGYDAFYSRCLGNWLGVSGALEMYLGLELCYSEGVWRPMQPWLGVIGALGMYNVLNIDSQRGCGDHRSHGEQEAGDVRLIGGAN